MQLHATLEHLLVAICRLLLPIGSVLPPFTPFTGLNLLFNGRYAVLSVCWSRAETILRMQPYVLTGVFNPVTSDYCTTADLQQAMALQAPIEHLEHIISIIYH